jgi:hypothetical protein
MTQSRFRAGALQMGCCFRPVSSADYLTELSWRHAAAPRSAVSERKARVAVNKLVRGAIREDRRRHT